MSKPTILIVDDQPQNIQILIQILKGQYTTLAATSGERALELAFREPSPDLVLLDVQMPGMDGFMVCQTLRSDLRTHHIPVIFVTALNEARNEAHGLSLGAVDYLSKPVVPELVLARIKNHLELDRYRKGLESLVADQTRHLLVLNEEIESTLLETLQTLGEIAELRSKETGYHVRRVMEYSHLLATLTRLDERESELLRQASSMHDIGKMAIPDAVLNKPGKLDEDELEIMRKHAEYGYRMLKSSKREIFQAAAVVAFSHHEKWDGSGYPQGLAGEEIPLYGRITAIADVFDALGSDRCYKRAWELERVLGFLQEQSGAHFDPELISLFFAHLDGFLHIRTRYQDQHTGE